MCDINVFHYFLVAESLNAMIDYCVISALRISEHYLLSAIVDVVSGS